MTPLLVCSGLHRQSKKSFVFERRGNLLQNVYINVYFADTIQSSDIGFKVKKKAKTRLFLNVKWLRQLKGFGS